MAAFAQLLPPGMQQFADGNGVPLVGGLVYMYVPPVSTTFKDTWLDRDEIVKNTNPVVLDAAGRAVIYGQGQYRQVLRDQFGALVWDKLVEFVEPTDVDVTVYDLATFIAGKPSNAEVCLIWDCPRSLVLPAGLTASQFSVATFPTAAMLFTFARNGISIGSVSFSTLGVPTVIFLAPVAFAASDQLTVTAQAVADATGGNVAMTFVFTIV
jgi:hypothetical protein